MRSFVRSQQWHGGNSLLAAVRFIKLFGMRICSEYSGYVSMKSARLLAVKAPPKQVCKNLTRAAAASERNGAAGFALGDVLVGGGESQVAPGCARRSSSCCGADNTGSSLAAGSGSSLAAGSARELGGGSTGAAKMARYSGEEFRGCCARFSVARKEDAGCKPGVRSSVKPSGPPLKLIRSSC